MTHALPLDFSLRNANDESVLVLGGPQDLALKIQNNSPTPLFLNPLTGAHHFSLRFRAGVLHDHRNIGLDKAQLKHWDIDSREEQGDVVVGLRYKTPLTWAPARSLHLKLEGLRGELAGGTRATRVELSYEHIRNRDKDGALVTGKPRHHQLVLTMAPPGDAPAHRLLEAHFVGETGNVVLNDGRPHNYSIDLRLTNTTAERLHIRDTTAFDVSFADGPPDLPGALATKDYLQKCVLTAHLVRDASVAAAIPLECRPVQNQPAVWMLRAPENSGDDLWLGPAGYLEIKVGKIRTEHRNGPSNVHVRWTNLSHPDGDMSGELVATVQKSPLVVVGHKVGIGSIPTPNGPDFDSAATRETLAETLALTKATRESLALATKAIRAVVDSSILGRVAFVPWRFSEFAGGQFEWPTVRWSELEVYWPGRGRVRIPWREHSQQAWRELFGWCRRYEDPGPTLESGQYYFERSPHEILYMCDAPKGGYPGAPAVPQGPDWDPYYDVQFFNHAGMAKMTMGLPLKPNSSLYARIHLGGDSDPNQSSVFFEDLSDPGETLPLDAVFIARWDEKGVTIGCDFELASSDQSGRLGNWSYSPSGRPVIKFTPETLKAAPLPPAP